MVDDISNDCQLSSNEIKVIERKNKDRLQELITWITKEEVVRLTPVVDRILVTLLRVLHVGGYFLLRLLLRLILGREKRDEVFIRKRIHLILGLKFDFVPIFCVIGLLNLIKEYFKCNYTFLLKITVPKYNYKSFCPTTRNDLINLSVREDEIIELFRPKEGQIVVDVGAHFGRYTLIASKRVGLTGKVVSIEADVGNFGMLTKNIKLNKLTNVLPLNYAAYSKSAILRLNLRYEGLSNSIYNTVMSNRFESDSYQEIRAEKLDTMLQSNLIDLNSINWIKIDVEGAELEVLKGATALLSQNHDISLLIETHRLGGDITLYSQIKEFLESYQFKIIFEKVYDGGERHIIAKKNVIQTIVIRRSN
jgi:FkbM family methyltransferase